MWKLKTKWFNRWARKNKITDDLLNQAISNMNEGKGSVDLGSGLYKIRVAKSGGGKSGRYRTILVYQKDDRAIFVFGFSKNEKENLDQTELKFFKKLSKTILSQSVLEMKELVDRQEYYLVEIQDEE